MSAKEENPTRAERLSCWLGRVPSLYWIGIYLLTILLFAGLFTVADPGGFHHSTIQREEEFVDLKIKLADAVANATATNLKGWNEGNISLGELILGPGLIHYEGSKAYISLYAIFDSPTGYMSAEYLMQFIPVASEFTLTDDGNKAWLHKLRVENKKIHRNFLTSQETALIANSFDSVEHTITVHDKEDTLLYDLFSAENGSAHALPGGFPRMLYLSAVTITTLGYGDIIPTTAMNRFLVAAESVIGILLIGLFLNSIAQEITRAQRRD